MRTAVTLLCLAGALALGACNRGPEQQPLEDNVTAIENVADNVEVPVEAPVANVSNASNVATKAAPAPAFTDEQQMTDDADATGMTARLPDEEPGQKGNETRPAE